MNTLETGANEVCDFPNDGGLHDLRAAPTNARRDPTSNPWEPTTDGGDQDPIEAISSVLPSFKNAARGVGGVTPQQASGWRELDQGSTAPNRS